MINYTVINLLSQSAHDVCVTISQSIPPFPRIGGKERVYDEGGKTLLILT
jgi:hypothetical protein